MLVYLFQGPSETNLKAVCSDPEAARNGSNLIWSNQELKAYFEGEAMTNCEIE